MGVLTESPGHRHVTLAAARPSTVKASSGHTTLEPFTVTLEPFTDLSAPQVESAQHGGLTRHLVRKRAILDSVTEATHASR